MKELNDLLSELGISKVRLAKYLGVSRQMLYNYLSLGDIYKWPKEKFAKLFTLLNVVENRLNDGVKDSSDKDYIPDLKGFNKKEQELISDIVNLMKEKLADDKTKVSYNTYVYLYNFLNSMETNAELRYMLGFFSKYLGFTEPDEYVFDEDKQFILEGILYSAVSLYNGGKASKSKVAKSHEDFEQEMQKRKEERLSRTQELNVARDQAMKELGLTEINDDNANEFFEKVAEITVRNV